MFHLISINFSSGSKISVKYDKSQIVLESQPFSLQMRKAICNEEIQDKISSKE